MSRKKTHKMIQQQSAKQMTTDIELGRVFLPKKKIDATCSSKKQRRSQKCWREERKKNKNSWRILIHSNAILVVPRFVDCVRVQTTVASSFSSSSFSWFYIVIKNLLKMEIKLKKKFILKIQTKNVRHQLTIHHIYIGFVLWSNNFGGAHTLNTQYIYIYIYEWRRLVEHFRRNNLHEKFISAIIFSNIFRWEVMECDILI